MDPWDEEYYTWLHSLVDSVRSQNPARTHWNLTRRLFHKEFDWFVPNDDNRAVDGTDLRLEFLEVKGLDDPDPIWMDLGCSMLEMLIGLSRRFAFQMDGVPRDWFWHMLANVDLAKYRDSVWEPGVTDENVDSVLDRIIFRTYAPDGSGGLFPLRHARKDQRGVELWYQLAAYILEFE